MAARNYRRLDAWQRSMELVQAVYALTSEYPTQERFGLIAQTQRAAVSIPSNIAEGYGRLHRGDYVHHISIARGSLCELETLLTIAARSKLAPRHRIVPVWNLAQDVGRILTKLLAALRSTRHPTPDTRHPKGAAYASRE